MMRRLPARAALVLAVALAGCDGDDGTRPSNVGYADLTHKNDVLQNLEHATNQLNVDRYLEVLDPGAFEFFFSSYDAAQGGIPGLWDYDEERACVETMFRRGGGTGDNPLVAFRLELVDLVEAAWTEYSPVTRPGRYETTVAYTLRVETENGTSYIAPGAPYARIRIKQTDVGGRMIWRIVEWYDVDVFGPNIHPSAPGVEQATWGSLKLLYQGNSYAELSEKGDVLYNLQRAMNQMRTDRYVEALDPSQFVFYFSPGEVAQGTVPPSWGFAEENACAGNMLGGGGSNPIVSINLDLVDFENAEWVEFDPAAQPGQFETTVGYTFAMDTENETTYITSGTPRAQVRIEQESVGGKMIWRIVQWNDIADTRAALDAARASTEASTWGSVKGLYQGE
jgi:hypothetical protein